MTTPMRLPRRLLFALLALGLCLANVLLNHVNAPSGSTLTPVIVLMLTGMLNWNQHYVAANAAGTALLICLNDAGLRFYGGGAHDAKGGGVITALLFIGLLPAYVLLLLLGRNTNTASAGHRGLAALLPPLLIGAYLAAKTYIE